MNVVTAIAPAPRRPNLCSVAVGVDQFLVTPEAVVRLGLRVGRDLDEGALGALRHEGEVQRVVDRALRMLAFRARSSAELKRGLARKGERGPEVDAALARLAAAGVLDDEAFGRQFARSRLGGGGVGRSRVVRELVVRGLDRASAEGAVREAADDAGVSEGETAERVARKKLRSLEGLEPAVRRRRLYGFLARRGFGHDEIARAMRAVGV
jgi:regulatory protein